MKRNFVHCVSEKYDKLFICQDAFWELKDEIGELQKPKQNIAYLIEDEIQLFEEDLQLMLREVNNKYMLLPIFKEMIRGTIPVYFNKRVGDMIELFIDLDISFKSKTMKKEQKKLEEFYKLYYVLRDKNYSILTVDSTLGFEECCKIACNDEKNNFYILYRKTKCTDILNKFINTEENIKKFKASIVMVSLYLKERLKESNDEYNSIKVIV